MANLNNELSSGDFCRAYSGSVVLLSCKFCMLFHNSFIAFAPKPINEVMRAILLQKPCCNFQEDDLKRLYLFFQLFSEDQRFEDCFLFLVRTQDALIQTLHFSDQLVEFKLKIQLEVES